VTGLGVDGAPPDTLVVSMLAESALGGEVYQVGETIDLDH
jgi:hypothetical protein